MNVVTSIIEYIQGIRSEITGFFGNILIHSPWIIVIYIITIIILIIWIRYSTKTFHIINTKFRVEMDNLYYRISLLLYHNRESIHDFENNIPLLLRYKTTMIAQKENAFYYNEWDKLIEEIVYIYTLTDTDPSSINKDQIYQHYTIVKNLTSTLGVLKNTLHTLTLGLSKLFY